jgi:DNA-binding beta-propeller fold protein YncE
MQSASGMTAIARLVALAAALLAVATSASAAPRGGVPLRVVANVPLPGPANRFDYASIDPSRNRLYIAHMDADELLVFDLAKRKVVRTIAAPGVHGVIAVPGLNRVYASATDAHELYTLDAVTGKVIARAPAGAYPDGLAYDFAERRVFVSDESGGIEAVFDALGHRIGTVSLGGEAGNVQYDPRSGHVLVDVQSRNELAVIDPRREKVVRRVGLPGCDHDHGLHLDLARRLAFVACDGNATLLTVDLDRMRMLSSATVGSSPDVLALDTASHRLYVAAESGDLAVFAERGRRLVKLGQEELAPEAHTVAVDARTHLVYFPLERGSRGKPELRIMAPTGRRP